MILVRLLRGVIITPGGARARAPSSDFPTAAGSTAPEVLPTLVAQMAAIEPIYRDEAETFCLLESGYMSEALRQAADGLTLRDAGDPADGGPSASPRHSGWSPAIGLSPAGRWRGPPDDEHELRRGPAAGGARRSTFLVAVHPV